MPIDRKGHQMVRKSVVAATVATGVVLLSGTVAGVALVQALNPDPAIEAVAVVATTSAAPTDAGIDPQFPPVQPLPSLPATAGVASADSPTAGDPVQDVALMGRAGSVDAVLAAAPGTVVKAWPTDRGGYRAYAVQVKRADGSVVTGFVDRETGTVFDWVQDSGPTSAARSPGHDDDDAGEYEGGGHESGEHEAGEDD